MTGRRFLVRGRVQGVGFRWFVVRAARGLDLSGHTRNLADGTVEVMAQGEGGALARLEELLAEGPPSAAVSGVDASDVPVREGLSGFDVTY